MFFEKDPIHEEKNTITKMVKIYCAGVHNSKDILCEDCRSLLEYAYKRLDYCRFGKDKPTCAKCPIHCYKPDMKEKVRKVMKYAGPRMVYLHPLAAIRHLIKGMKNK